MKISILTLFPSMFDGPFTESIIKRAVDAEVCEIEIVDIRDFTHDKHNTADDTPYGGGCGMVMKVEPVVEAVESVTKDSPDARVIYLSPQGPRFTQNKARELAALPHLVLLCGHYEGIDERAFELAVHEELSIGDYVLTGGELPAMVVADSVIRLLPGAVGNDASVQNDSFWNGLLDCPHYTRPEEYRGLRVPGVLLSGHHAKIDEWRHQQALEKTHRIRPDLYETYHSTDPQDEA
ncbi:tRNA (guanosine(37)-N1)-methyltransferase TrmD [Candidatus Sumerlaeota bacterium]|nr:tRNA (guanosine(37)-N1)-methyltransferase TrmD [Candidatus Sumerlaeota bacterium]